MKVKIFLFVFILNNLLFFSCSSDENSNTSDEQDEIIEENENEAPQEQDVELVIDNITIQGASKKDGAPTPNEAISFSLNSENNIALLREGFNISLNSDDDITGAYIQFKSDDKIAGSYFDVNFSQLENRKVVKKTKKKGLKRNLNKIVTDENTEIDVDFTAQIEPGIFCYIICVYDAEGNISAPQEVCVTVKSWGGNNDLAGTWNLIRKDRYNTFDPDTLIYNAGIVTCYGQNEFTCYNESTSTYGHCEILDGGGLILNSDGTYSDSQDETQKVIDIETSKINCEATYDDVDYFINTSGKWSYVADEEELILVEYGFEEGYYGNIGSEVYAEGYAYPSFSKISYEGNTLILLFEDQDGDKSYFFKYYYEKQ